jgi:hypothetical protein
MSTNPKLHETVHNKTCLWTTAATCVTLQTCVREIVKINRQLRHGCPLVSPSVHKEKFGSHWTDSREIFHYVLLLKFLKKIKFIQSRTNRVTLREYLSRCIKIPWWIVPVMRKFQNKLVEKFKTYFRSHTFVPPTILSFQKLLPNVRQSQDGHNVIWRKNAISILHD